MDSRNDVNMIAKMIFRGVLLFIVPDIILCMLGKNILMCVGELIFVFMPAMLIYFSKKIPQKHKKYIWGFFFLYKFLYVIPSKRMRVLYGVLIFIASASYAVYYSCFITPDREEENAIVFIWTVYYALHNPFFGMMYVQLYDTTAHTRIYIVSAIVAVVVAFVIVKKYGGDMMSMLKRFASLVLVMTLVIGISFTALNFALDNSEPIYFNAPITDKHPGSRGVFPSLTVGGMSDGVNIYVDRYTYEYNDPGYVIPAALYDGFFGIKYISLEVY